MRLWPYQLIPYLPYRHLLGQWREVLAVSGMYARNEINHCIIDRVKDYSPLHLSVYTDIVKQEMIRREYKIGENALEKLMNDINYPTCLQDVTIMNVQGLAEDGAEPLPLIGFSELGTGGHVEILFQNFHHKRYLLQCLLKFQEFHDCAALDDHAWDTMRLPFLKVFPNVDLI